MAIRLLRIRSSKHYAKFLRIRNSYFKEIVLRRQISKPTVRYLEIYVSNHILTALKNQKICCHRMLQRFFLEFHIDFKLQYCMELHRGCPLHMVWGPSSSSGLHRGSLNLCQQNQRVFGSFWRLSP
jgi:hypothetical protein